MSPAPTHDASLTVGQLLMRYWLWSIERLGEASQSERRRWVKNRSVEINGYTNWQWDEQCLPVMSLVLHPKSAKRRVTLV